jgi:hypothetical protein
MDIKEAKDAILKDIIGNEDYVHSPADIKLLAESYAILVSAEIQELMTKHAISGCEHGGLDEEIIG